MGVNADGTLDPAHVRAAITDATCLISIMHSNNEVGSLQPVAEISQIAKQHNISLHSDAAQSIGKVIPCSHLPVLLRPAVPALSVLTHLLQALKTDCAVKSHLAVLIMSWKRWPTLLQQTA